MPTTGNTFATAILAALGASACAPIPSPSGGEVPRATRPVPAITARGVELSVPTAAGEIAARARELSLGRDGGAMLRGAVHLTFTELKLEARGDRLEVARGGDRLVLSGGVRAALDLDGGGTVP